MRRGKILLLNGIFYSDFKKIVNCFFYNCVVIVLLKKIMVRDMSLLSSFICILVDFHIKLYCYMMLQRTLARFFFKNMFAHGLKSLRTNRKTLPRVLTSRHFDLQRAVRSFRVILHPPPPTLLKTVHPEY